MKLAIYSGFTHKKMVIFHSYVKLPEGTQSKKPPADHPPLRRRGDDTKQLHILFEVQPGAMLQHPGEGHWFMVRFFQPIRWDVFGNRGSPKIMNFNTKIILGVSETLIYCGILLCKRLEEWTPQLPIMVAGFLPILFIASSSSGPRSFFQLPENV